MPKVKFIEVGRSKSNWEAEYRGDLTESWLYKQAKKALMSRDIWFTDSGIIFAGIRSVGKFEIIEEE